MNAFVAKEFYLLARKKKKKKIKSKKKIEKEKKSEFILSYLHSLSLFVGPGSILKDNEVADKSM